MEDIAAFLLALYRAARELDDGAFEAVVLASLQPTFAFAGALWGGGRFEGGEACFVPNRLAAQNVDPAFLLDWSRLQHQDPIVERIHRGAGNAVRIQVPSFYAAIPELVEFARSNRIESMTVVAVRPDGPRSMEWVSLYRERADALCSDPEKRWLETLLPHLSEAARIHRALRSTETAMSESNVANSAVVEACSGRVLCAGSGFVRLLVQEWSGFDGRLVPPALRSAWHAPGAFTQRARRCVVRGRRGGELVYLTAIATALAAPDAPTARQLQIAELFCEGLSSKQIAQQVGIAPSTVRNHLASVYAVLGVHSRVELERRLVRLRGGIH